MTGTALRAAPSTPGGDVAFDPHRDVARGGARPGRDAPRPGGLGPGPGAPHAPGHGAPHAPGPGRVLRLLVAVQHAMFAALLVASVAAALSRGDAPAPVLAAAVVLGGCYLAGLRLARHRPIAWLLVLAACWLAAVVVSESFIWLGFVLWLLAGHFLTGPAALAFALGTLAVVLGAPLLHGEPLTLAGVLGPTLGAVFALALSTGEHALVRDALERERLVENLVRAQAEAEELHAEVAATQRELGALAERTRLSRDIHDTLAQGFSSIVLLARAGRAAEAQPPETLARIEEVAAENLDEARRLVAALAPRGLTPGIVAALQRQLDLLREAAGVAGELRLDGDLDSLPTAVEVALLRTVQGALANVRGHARASRVVLTLARTDDSVLLDVADDGVGFDADAWASRAPGPAGRGYGLHALRSRLRELGGDVEVTSAPGAGTVVSARLPCGGPDAGGGR